MAPSKPETFQQGFVGILMADIIAAKERHRAEDSQPNRRDLIRTVFSAVEGLAWTYREHITSAARDIGAISIEEELALSEINYQVTDQGKIVGQSRFISMPAMVRLTTRIASKLDPNLEVRFDTAGWDKFRRAITIRNRVTHPKREVDLLISSEDVATCLAAYFWLMDIAASAMEAANAALVQYLERFSEVFEDLKAGDPETWAEYRSLVRDSDE